MPLFTPIHSILTWGGSEALPKFFLSNVCAGSMPLFTPNHSILTWGGSEALPKFFYQMLVQEACHYLPPSTVF